MKKKEVKTVIKTIRFSESEINKLENKAKKLRVDLSKYMRAKLLDDKDVLTRVPEVNADLIKQVRRIGNNINQIAFKVNSSGRVGEDVVNFKNDINEMKTILNQIVKELSNR